MKQFKQFINESNKPHFDSVKDFKKVHSIVQSASNDKEAIDGIMKELGHVENLAKETLKKYRADLKNGHFKTNETESQIQERKVNTSQAANGARKVIDTIDKFESMVVDMQDQDVIDSKAAKMYDKAAKEMRKAIDEIEGHLY